jgi:hypothetical protein
MMLRCYNSRGYTRVELQMRRGHARNFLANLFARSLEELPELALGAVRSFVDFVDTTADKNISRCPLLPFWSDFVGLIEKVRLAPPRPPASLTKYLQHVRKQAGMFWTYLASLSVMGLSRSHVLSEFLEHGAAKMTDRQRFLVLAASKLVGT